MCGCRCVVLLSTALGAAACEAKGEAPPPDARSEYVDLYLDDGIDVCGGQMASYDGFLTRAFELWTGEVPEGFRVSVHATHENDCDYREASHSCTQQGDAWLVSQFSQYHELGHLVHLAADGGSVTALQEGVASALGPGDAFAVKQASLADAGVDFLFARDPADTNATHAAVLTRFLVDRYGVASFRSYFRALAGPDHPEPADFEREFEAAFGESLDNVWSEVTSRDRCAYDLWYCEPWAPVELPFELDGIDCEAPTTLGFDSGYTPGTQTFSGGPTTMVHVEVGSPRTIVLDHDADADILSVDFGRCGECSPMDPTSSYLKDGFEGEPIPGCPAGQSCVFAREFELEPGRYAFLVRQRTDEPARLSLAEKPVP